MWWFQIFFIFTPTWGRWIQFDEHIFQMGLVKNHQLGMLPNLHLPVSGILKGLPPGFGSFHPTPPRNFNPEQTTPGGWAKSKPYGYHPSWQSLGVTKIQLWGLDLGESFNPSRWVRRMDENLMFWVDFLLHFFFVCLTYLGCPLFKGWMFFDGMGVWSC